MAKKVDLPEPIIPNDSWKVVKLGQYVKILNGYPFDSSRFTNSNENTYPLIRIRDVVRGYTETFTDEDCPDEYKIKKGEILIGMDGDFNISRWKSDFGLINQRVCKISTVSKDLDEKFLFYYLPIPLKLINDATPSVTVKHLSSTSLQELHFPLPTLAEQQRIVNRIESMFAKLDEAKENAQNVVDGFETRKAAILHKAFTGELTAKWRKENGVCDDSWVEKTIGECGSVYGGGTPSTSHKDYWENGNILWITSKDMKNDIIEDSEMHVNMKGIENSSAKFIEKPALLFVMRSGILRRTFPICMVKKEFTVNQDLKALVPYGFVLLEYLFYVCKSNEREILNTCMKNGTTVESINAKALFDFVIFVPTLPEQVEIVRILDIIIEKENKAKQAAEAVLEQIDLLKKSILARAFRGEL